MVLAVLLALGAAAAFAAGSALQHRVAGASPAGGESRVGFLLRLVHQPSWLVGLLLSALAFSLHALALSQGDLALVQPVIVSGIVFAVLIRAWLVHQRPPARTLTWLILTWLGLALFLIARPMVADHQPDLTAAGLITGLGVLISGGLLVAAQFATVSRRRGVLLATAAGVLFGLVAGEAKLVLRRLQVAGVGAVFTYWPFWILLIVGLAAIVSNQRAYQATRLSVTAPVLNIAQVLVALGFGAVVLDETAGSNAIQLILQLLGLILVITGVVRLASKSGVPDEDVRLEARTDPTVSGRRLR